MDQFIDIVFSRDEGDGSNPPEFKFVEVENEDGASIGTGEWLQNSDIASFDEWRLRLKVKPGLNGLAEKIRATSTSHGFWPTDREEALASAGYLGGAMSRLGADQQDMTHIEAVIKYIQAQQVRNVGEMLMLATSELAEALEEHRDGSPAAYWACKRCGARTATLFDTAEEIQFRHPESGHHYTQRDNPYNKVDQGGNDCWGEFKPEGILVELADCIIRCLDTGKDYGDMEHAAGVKMAFNDRREHMHGKAY